MFNTPVLLIIFNRPDVTAKVLESLSHIKPAKLYVAADGPRPGRETDIELCRETRALIDETITWDCKIERLYRNENLGCGKAVSGAITWFFENNEYGIILEDDCLADDSFYSFCEELLLKYKHDDKIMHIGGTNFQDGQKRGEADYYFSAETHVWGWASWSRAWKKYDFDISGLDKFISLNKLKKYYNNPEAINYWHSIYKRMQKHEIDTWDYQWRYCIANAGGLAIIPQQNLVSNIGFGASATHTFADSPFANMARGSITSIIDPAKIAQDKEADNYTFLQHYKPEIPRKKSLVQRAISKFKRIINEL